MKKIVFILLFASIAIGAVLLLSKSGEKERPKASFVGSSTCADCHQEQFKEWHDSHHAKAMDVANDQTVLAPFKGESLTTKGVKATFLQEDGKYFIDTTLPSGNAVRLPVRYVIGITPLQQYLVEYPNTGKKDWDDKSPLPNLQTVPMSWDVEKQQWFHLYPDETFSENDPIHWSGWAQNWNHMCADCHMTDLDKGATPNLKTYHTSYKEMSVGCESCHGPGSNHVDDHQKMFNSWSKKEKYGMAEMAKTQSKHMMKTCAKCHAFREQTKSGHTLHDTFEDFYQVHHLNESHYFHDGQIKEEVYVYGSYTQSKMYRMGVSCIDCHNPHTNKIKLKGNNLCYQCHDKNVFGQTSHHQHQVGSSGSQCVECHMPERTYMGIDRRRDHSIRVPRPDLSLKIGSPNACVGCHLDPKRQHQSDEYAKLLTASSSGNQQASETLKKLNTWAANTLATWPNVKKDKGLHYGEVFYKARQGDPTAEKELISIGSDNVHYGPITRATALSLLRNYASSSTQRALTKALYHDDPLIRRASLMGQVNKQEVQAWQERLKDTVLSVRLEAFQNLLQLPPDYFRQITNSAEGKKVVAEFLITTQYHADQSGSHMNLARYYEKVGDSEAAMKSYYKAIELQPSTTGPRSNLSELLLQLGREKEANQLRKEEVLLMERDVKISPLNHELHYRYGLLLYLLQDYEKALGALDRASQIEPGITQYRMVYILLLEKMKRYKEALNEIQLILKKNPQDQQIRAIQRRILQNQ